MTAVTEPRRRRTQADRRARSTSALLEAAARGMSKYGYANVALETVASEAGYTRGALYHLFAKKEDLALAVVKWVAETWDAEVGQLATDETDPVEALLAMARGHAVYCRRDLARVMMTLRVEFSEQDHPVGRAIDETLGQLAARCTELVVAGRRTGAIPPGPPADLTAAAYLVVLEAIGMEISGTAPHDVELAERAARGVLGLPPAGSSRTTRGSASRTAKQSRRNSPRAGSEPDR